MDERDQQALDSVLEDLIDTVVRFKGGEEHSDEDLIELMQSMDYGKFIVSGIIYSNGICVCGDCAEHDEDN